MTIAQQLKITEFPFEIKDSRGNQIYLENSKGFWERCEYDSMNNRVYLENSTDYWSKREFDSNGKEIYFENSGGYIQDIRPKTILTMDEIAAKFNVPVETLKIKK